MSPVLIQPVKNLGHGLLAYGQGLRWLRRHPRYLVLLFLPMLLGLGAAVATFGAFVAHDDQIVSSLIFAKPIGPDASLWLLPVYYGLWALMYVAAVVLVLVTTLLLINILAAPLYEVVSVALEKDLTGQEPPSLGLKGNIKVAFAELKKALFIVIFSTIMLFIPGLNVISLVLSAFLIGWNFFDYPVARRGWSFRERLVFVRREFWSVLGLGLWLIVPFVQIVMMPLAVPGGTILGIEALRRRHV